MIRRKNIIVNLCVTTTRSAVQCKVCQSYSCVIDTSTTTKTSAQPETSSFDLFIIDYLREWITWNFKMPGVCLCLSVKQGTKLVALSSIVSWTWCFLTSPSYFTSGVFKMGFWVLKWMVNIGQLLSLMQITHDSHLMKRVGCRAMFCNFQSETCNVFTHLAWSTVLRGSNKSVFLTLLARYDPAWYRLEPLYT